MSDNPPDGFKAFPDRIPAVTHVGPYYYSSGDGVLRVGFRAQKHHCNLSGVVHGGMLMTLADFTLCSAAIHGTKEGCATITFNADFIGPGMMDAWIQAEARVLHRTGSMVFTQGTVTSNDGLALNFTGVVRRIRPK